MKTLEQAEADLHLLRNDQMALLAQLARADGKLESTGQLVASLEAGAKAAEARPSDPTSGRRGAAASARGKCYVPAKFVLASRHEFSRRTAR